jgi:hypothetical protein
MKIDCLIALFSIDYLFLKEVKLRESISSDQDYNESQEALAKAWAKEPAPASGSEMACFQNTLSSVKDCFPAGFRRFILVGNSPEEQVRNIFELGFEKGYRRVIFVEHILENISTEKINHIIAAWEGTDMVLVPGDEGRVSIWGMNEKAFWKWDEFRFYVPEIVVEMIAEAMEKNISYKIVTV